MRPTGNWRPALLDLETDLAVGLPLPRPPLAATAAELMVADSSIFCFDGMENFEMFEIDFGGRW